MKKICVFALSMVILFGFTACGSSMGDINDKQINDEISRTEESSTEEVTGITDQNVEDDETIVDDDVSIAEQVIYEGNEIKVTATGFDSENFFGPAIKVLIENNSPQDITIQSRNSSVNGLMVDTIFSADVAAGKKANDSIVFFSSDLEISGITTIKEIELSLHVIDAESWDSIVDTDTIVIRTSADESFVQEYDDSGFIAYDSDGIKIVTKKLNSSDSFWGSELYLYIENNIDKHITVQTRDVSINGFMVDPIFSCDIMSGKKSFDAMTFLESDLTNNGITDITELELEFHIFDMTSWDTIKDTDIVYISFE